MKITTIEDIVFNYIEFFFSKEELNAMFKIKPLSHHVWLEILDGMYSTEPTETNESTSNKSISTESTSNGSISNGSEDSNSSKFHYNIMHTDAYKNIMKYLQDIKNILIKSDESARSKMKVKQDIKDIYIKIKSILESEDLHYYEQTYVYAHYIFNNIRNNGIKIKGGGKHIKNIKDMSLEEFKDAIREKIKELEL